MSRTSFETLVAAAQQRIAQTPGYASVARDLARMIARGRIEFVPDLPDRAQATLRGRILLGPEALDSSPLSVAQTLIHEHFHLRQHPLQKTASFWTGVATGTPIMRRFERPAYEAALTFLDTVSATFPEYVQEARQEADAVRAVFAACYGASLRV